MVTLSLSSASWETSREAVGRFLPSVRRRSRSVLRIATGEDRGTEHRRFIRLGLPDLSIEDRTHGC
jgi:hypothetical protein